MKKIVSFLFFVALVIFTVPVYAQQNNITSSPNVISAFRHYINTSPVSVKVPTVVEVAIANSYLERYDFAVFNLTANIFEPYYFKKETLVNNIPVSIKTNPYISDSRAIVDGNDTTFGEFSLPEGTNGSVEITLTSQEPITSSALVALFDTNVAFPERVEVRAVVNGVNKIVLANSRVEGNTIWFPKTSSRSWSISFVFAQPLRINELRLVQENTPKTNTQAIRFLAQPNNSYRIYLNPDRYVQTPVAEAGNLAQVTNVTSIKVTPSILNDKYVVSDQDGDSIADTRDNCVAVANPTQEDVNTNGRGDACDDFDEDSVINSKDNCLNNPNYDQKDTDIDGIGDVCDKEESRFTEQYPWIPWVGIGFAALVLITLFALTARMPHEPTQTPPNP